MAVDIAIPVAAIEDEETITSRTYAIDWEAGRIAGFIDEQEAVKQFISYPGFTDCTTDYLSASASV